MPAEYSSHFNPKTDLAETGLKEGSDYTIDEKTKTITIKNANAAKVMDSIK